MLKGRASERKQGGTHPDGAFSGGFLAGLILFILTFAPVALHAAPAPAQPAAGSAAPAAQADKPDRALTPARMRSGALLVRAASREGSPYIEARRTASDMSVTVDGPVARTVLTQTFLSPAGRNPAGPSSTGPSSAGETADGVYVLALPGDASVDTLAMQIGARAIKGEIVPRGEAGDLHGMTKPLPGAPANTFTSTVADIPAGETITIRVAYQRVLKWTDGGYALRLPAGAMRGAQAHPAGLQVKLQAGFALGAVDSPGHDAAIERSGEDGALIRRAGQDDMNGDVGDDIGDDRGVDRDFVLRWSPRDSGEPSATLFRQQAGKAEYVLAMLTPPAGMETGARRSRDVVFVIDTSGSMAGSAILQMRNALDDAIARLDRNDRFNIIAFDSTYEMLFEAPVPADAKGKAIARQFIDRLIASGATDLIRPLSAALRDNRPEDTDRIRQVVLITDDSLANAQKLLSEIAVRRGRSRLFLVGIGPVPRTATLRRAAEIGRGDHLHIASTHKVRAALDAFLKRLERPALTDIAVAWPKGSHAETMPGPIPDVYAGAPLIFTTRLDAAPQGKIVLTGDFGGEPWRKEIDIGSANEGHGIARLWARRKIASLEAQGHAAGQDGGDGVSARIEAVALEHRIVSRMTRLVAIEEPTWETASPGRPYGLVHSGAIDFARETLEMRRPRAQAGTRNGTALRMVMAPRTAPETAPGIAPQMTSGIVMQAAAGAVSATAQEADQPDATDRTATAQAGRALTPPGADRTPGQQPFLTARLGAIAVMALMFAAMSALTLGLWRQFGRLHRADAQDDNRRGK